MCHQSIVPKVAVCGVAYIACEPAECKLRFPECNRYITIWMTSGRIAQAIRGAAFREAWA